MPRLFEIVPTVASVRREDGSIVRDDRVMYLVSEEAESALDVILEPYGEIGAFYLDKMHAKSPGPWAYVVLRQEYDIANYVIAQRTKLDSSNTFSFTLFDNSVDIMAAGFIPKVGCFLFFSKNSIKAAASEIRFLEPAWSLLREMSTEQHWLVLLDEEPALVLAEGRQC